MTPFGVADPTAGHYMAYEEMRAWNGGLDYSCLEDLGNFDSWKEAREAVRNSFPDMTYIHNIDTGEKYKVW